MKTKLLSTLFTLFLLGFVSFSHGQQTTSDPLRFSAGVLTGYNRGFGMHANIMAHNFAPGFPFELRFGMGYTLLNPGNAADARRIFINNATNGTPEKKGRSFDIRFDFLLSKPLFGTGHSYLVLGPRFSTFRGNFVYVGGNEDFDVTSHQWGIGAGIENHFRMTSNLNLIMAIGLDHYFPSTLTGHDTSYSPDNDNINPREDNQDGDTPFTYRDADKAIRQPVFMPRAMIGVSFGL
ncbi:MAG: hypothetical protein JW830_14285 [Bacteroidales bacterium]|nr:hypothetical protein [Bacteroidales bacterium]